MQPLISDEVKASLVEQFSLERYNASVYTYIAAFLKGKGLTNLAKFFEHQDEEEWKHSRIIYDLLTDLGVSFDILPIEGCAMPFNTIQDIAELYLQREVSTTDSLKAIRDQSASMENGGCPVVEAVMIDMIKMQQSELDEATTFYDKAQLFKEWWQVGLWDASLGE